MWRMAGNGVEGDRITRVGIFLLDDSITSNGHAIR